MKKNDADTIELFRFFIAGECYAVQLESLQEVAEPVVVAPMPFSEAYVSGLINLSGQMILQLDAGLLVQAKAPSSQQVLLIVDVAGEAFALGVDALEETVTVAKSSFVEAKSFDDGELSVKLVENSKLIEVSQLKQLFSANRILPSNTNQELFQQDWQEQVREQELDFLQFRLGSKFYVMALPDLLEIVEVDDIQALAKSPDCIEGLCLLRGQPRLILSLAQLLGTQAADGSNALMVFHQGYVLGLMVDEAIGVLKALESELHFDDANQLVAVNCNDKPIEVLQAEALLQQSVMGQIKPFLTLAKEQKSQQVVYKELLMINVANKSFAVPLEHASRISYQGELSLLPEAQGFVYATMEFQGAVIPVLDLPKILGLAQADTPLVEYLVVSSDGQYWALKIDASLRIVEVPESSVSYTEASDGYLLGYCDVDEKLLSILNVDNICISDDAEAVS